MSAPVFILLALYLTQMPRPTALVAEFSSNQKCEAAARALKQATEERRHELIYVCVEK